MKGDVRVDSDWPKGLERKSTNESMMMIKRHSG